LERVLFKAGLPASQSSADQNLLNLAARFLIREFQGGRSTEAALLAALLDQFGISSRRPTGDAIGGKFKLRLVPSS